MDSWVGYQVGLEFSEIHIQSSIKSQRGRNRRHNLTNKSVKICVGWAFDVKITAANVVNCLFVLKIIMKIENIFGLLIVVSLRIPI